MPQTQYSSRHQSPAQPGLLALTQSIKWTIRVCFFAGERPSPFAVPIQFPIATFSFEVDLRDSHSPSSSTVFLPHLGTCLSACQIFLMTQSNDPPFHPFPSWSFVSLSSGYNPFSLSSPALYVVFFLIRQDPFASYSIIRHVAQDLMYPPTLPKLHVSPFM